MKSNQILAAVVVLAVVMVGYFGFMNKQADPTPQNVTLTGTYTCLPHMNTEGPQTEECAFGMKTPEGDYYATNFGASAAAMEQFEAGATITAEGFVVQKDALTDSMWDKYNMKGLFTITKVISPVTATSTPPQAKINIDAVCQGALAYTTFPDGASAEKFVAECKEGKHPEVIEQYKVNMGLGDGAQI